MLNKKTLKLYLLVFISIAVVAMLPARLKYQTTDTSKNVVYLGNPLKQDGKKGRSLNIWDLQAFDGKIYLAGGSTVENAGPINVWAYNPQTNFFNKEYTVNEEAIEHFKVFDNELYIPASDPRDGDTNKFYRKQLGGQWQKYSSNKITLAHVRDLIKTDLGEIIVVGNNRQVTNISKPGAAISSNNNLSFSGAGIDKDEIPSRNNVPIIYFNWFFSVFSYKNIIYASTALLRNTGDFSGTVAVYNSQKKKFELDFNLRNSNFIPLSEINNSNYYNEHLIYRIWNPVEYQSNLLYTIRSYSISEDNFYHKNYMNSIDFYIKKGVQSSPSKVQLPDKKSLGEDILQIKNSLFVLANTQLSNNNYIIRVYKTSDLKSMKWQEILSFSSKNKARSFEYLNGNFYFGLGQDYGEPIGSSGEILSYQLTQSE